MLNLLRRNRGNKAQRITLAWLGTLVMRAGGEVVLDESEVMAAHGDLDMRVEGDRIRLTVTPCTDDECPLNALMKIAERLGATNPGLGTGARP